MIDTPANSWAVDSGDMRHGSLILIVQFDMHVYQRFTSMCTRNIPRLASKSDAESAYERDCNHNDFHFTLSDHE